MPKPKALFPIKIIKLMNQKINYVLYLSRYLNKPAKPLLQLDTRSISAALETVLPTRRFIISVYLKIQEESLNQLASNRGR